MSHRTQPASIDSPALAAVGTAFWAIALLAGFIAVITADPEAAQGIVSALEIPVVPAVVPHAWQFCAVTAAAGFVFGRAAHSINNHYPRR